MVNPSKEKIESMVSYKHYKELQQERDFLKRDADRYIYLLSHMGLVQRALTKWDITKHGPLLRYIQGFIDQGRLEAGEEFIKAQRDLLK